VGTRVSITHTHTLHRTFEIEIFIFTHTFNKQLIALLAPTHRQTLPQLLKKYPLSVLLLGVRAPAEHDDANPAHLASAEVDCAQLIQELERIEEEGALPSSSHDELV
jgi:hypothetical protein